LAKRTFELRYIFIGGNRFSFFSRVTYSIGLYIDQSCHQWQEYNLNPDSNNMVNVTKENLDALEEIGKKLLKKNVVKLNLDTFDLEHLGETNAQALDR